MGRARATLEEVGIVKRLAPYVTVALFAIWPYVNFAYANIYESFSYARILIIAVVTVAAALALFEIVKRLPLFRNPAAAAAFVALLIVVFFGYQLTNVVAHALFEAYHLRTWAAVALAASFLGPVVVRTRAVQAAAPVVGAILVAVPLAQIGLGLASGRAASMQAGEGVAAATERRSVYIFLHDGYPRDDILGQFGYDNAPFLGKLEEAGFYIATDAHANYDSTVRTLSSVFFMEPAGTTDSPLAYAVVANRALRAQKGDSPVHEFFLQNGYYTALFSSSARNCNPKIDLCATRWGNAFGLGQLEANLLKLTPLIHLADRLTFPDAYTYSVDVAGFLDEILGNAPVFMLAHILDVHPPYTFDETCQQSFEGHTDFVRDESGPRFLLAVECSNRILIATIERIVAADPDAIIIIAADHGSSFLFWLEGTSGDGLSEAMYERFATLSAWRMPPSCREPLHPSLTPINIFPIVLACLTGTPAHLFPDQSWFSWFGGNHDIWEPVSINLDREAGYDVGARLSAYGLPLDGR